MKNWTSPTRALVAALLAGGALAGASSAFAQSAPFALQADAPTTYGEAHLMPVDVTVSIGWHGDRYWDGHRYWAHDDWMRHHPHDPGPPHYHDDHHPPQHY